MCKCKATGLYLRNENIILSATLGGNVLESDKIMPGSTTIFDVNLVWETDKKSIKRYATNNLMRVKHNRLFSFFAHRMKTENLPIKLECFSVASGSARRDLIGFVMIPMRGIQIATGAKLAKVTKSFFFSNCIELKIKSNFTIVRSTMAQINGLADRMEIVKARNLLVLNHNRIT